MKTASRAALLVCTAMASIGMFAPAFAQEAAENAGLEEIVVTAQKREQNTQDVPVAVTTLTQDTLQVNRVVNIMDLNGLAPGLVARQNAGSLGSPSYTMRGVFASASVPAQDRQISTYVDGVYIGGTRGGVFDLPDLERIEVLRGPQGTLFGRNATAGAVSIVTRDPSGEFRFRQEVTVGNYAQLRTRTTVDLPQMGILSAYVTYVHDERRGDVRNLGAGTLFDRTASVTGIGVTRSPEWLGSKNAENIFAAVKLAPSDDFSLTYKFDLSHSNNTPEARVTTVINPNDFVGSVLTAVLATQPPGGGAFGPVPLFPDNKRPEAVNNAWTMPGYVRTSGHNLTLDWQATDSLSFKNVASYRQASALGITTIMGLSGLEYTAAAKAFFTAPQVFLGGASFAQALGANGDAPVGSYFAGYEGQSYGKYWQVSDELQANYQSQLLTLTVGGIWFHSNELSGGVPNMAPNVAFTPTGPVLALGNVQDTRQTTTSIAAYAQAEIHATSQLDVVLGARITRDKKFNTLTLGGTYSAALGSLTGASVLERTFKKTKPTFSAGLNYKVNDDILVYGKFSTAYLSGGSAGPLSFDPETVASWEAGLKSEWFDRRLRFNLAVYQATYKHTQSAQSGTNVVIDGQSLSAFGVVVIDNGTTKAKGIEVEVVAAPVTGLTLGGSLGYTDVTWENPSPFLTQGRPVAPSGIPKVMAAANAQYVTPPLVGDATMLFRIDGIYQGKFRAAPFTDVTTATPVFAPYEINPARWIVNARVALRDIKFGSLTGELGVWSRNLTNNRDAVYPLQFGSIQHNASYQPARTFGADFIVTFK
jgi:iron complex outermembrane recepter protein